MHGDKAGFIWIISFNKPAYKLIKNMQTKEQQKENDSLVFGLRPIMEALRAGKEIDRLFVQTGLKNELFGELMSLLKTI